MTKITHLTQKADKTLIILTSLYVTCLLANVAIGFRYISIFHIDMAGGIFIFPLSFIISDIISELYDSDYAKSLIWYGVACQFIFSLYIFFIIRLPYPTFWNNHDLYFTVFNPYLRFSLASAASIIIGSWLNIHFLSKWSKLVEGRYFALRSLGSSCIGELFTTVCSMLIANYGKMDNYQLIYMMLCCFFVKTIVSLVAVWPAAAFICIIKKDNSDFLNPQLSFFELLKLKLSNFSKPAFRLDSINSDEANIYCRGGRTTIIKKIPEVIFNPLIISHMSSIHSSALGYSFGLENTNNVSTETLLTEKTKFKFRLNFFEDKFIILSLTRGGQINYTKNSNSKIFTLKPSEIYRNEVLLSKFDPSHACYIGILVGLEDKKSDKKPKISRLKLIVNNHSQTL